MKVTVIKEKEEKNFNLISSIIMLILGIILTLNANQIVTTVFIILGILVVILSAIKLGTYFNEKKQLNIDNNDVLVSGILGMAIGLLTILLASILSNAIQIISGIWLLIVGLNKLTIYLKFKTNTIDLLIAIVLILLGVYTIIFANAVLMIIGIALILTSLYDIINNFKKQK